MTDRILGSDAAVAVGRFRPDGPVGYRARTAPDAPLRATRAEAEQDEARHLHGDLMMFPDLVPVDLTPPEVVEKLSAGRRLTLRQKADVEVGKHPLTRGRLAGNGETCGSCKHRVLTRWNGRTYPKCAQGIDPKTTPLEKALFASHSAATDCRAWWPACTAWEAQP